MKHRVSFAHLQLKAFSVERNSAAVAAGRSRSLAHRRACGFITSVKDFLVLHDVPNYRLELRFSVIIMS